MRSFKRLSWVFIARLETIVSTHTLTPKQVHTTLKRSYVCHDLSCKPSILSPIRNCHYRAVPIYCSNTQQPCGEIAVREPTCTSKNVTELRSLFSFLAHRLQLFPGLKQCWLPIYYGVNREKLTKIPRTSCIWARVPSDQCSNQRATVPPTVSISKDITDLL